MALFCSKLAQAQRGVVMMLLSPTGGFCSKKSVRVGQKGAERLEEQVPRWLQLSRSGGTEEKGKCERQKSVQRQKKDAWAGMEPLTPQTFFPHLLSQQQKMEKAKKWIEPKETPFFCSSE